MSKIDMNAAEMRDLTDAELDQISGGVIPEGYTFCWWPVEGLYVGSCPQSPMSRMGSLISSTGAAIQSGAQH